MRSHCQDEPPRRRGRLRPDTDSAELGGPSAAADLLRLQRSVGNAAVGGLLQEEPSPVHDVIRSGGSPLGAGIRAEMESRLGADFGDVRVHTDAAADASARSVQAHAYTVGSNVVFGRGMFDTNSQAGKTMLAHELTHVTQQRAGAVDGTAAPGGISLSDPSDRFEQAAVRNAELVMRQQMNKPPSCEDISGDTADRSACLDEPSATSSVQRATRSGRNGPVVQRGGNAPVDRGDSELPTVPSIAAAGTGVGSGRAGTHATAFLTTEADDGTLTHYKIDLTNLAGDGRPRDIAIIIKPAKWWASPGESTTWQISKADADKALARAYEFQSHQDEYWYQKWGIGPGAYNCSNFVEVILNAAGIKRSAGIFISTPAEIAVGSKTLRT